MSATTGSLPITDCIICTLFSPSLDSIREIEQLPGGFRLAVGGQILPPGVFGTPATARYSIKAIIGKCLLYKEYYIILVAQCLSLNMHNEGKEPRNPHVHILLTLRFLDEQGKWMPKCRKVYELDGSGNRMKLASGEWVSHRENVNNWNDLSNGLSWENTRRIIASRIPNTSSSLDYDFDTKYFSRKNKGQGVHLGK